MITSPHDSQQKVKAKVEELLDGHDITFYAGRRKQRTGDTVNIEWMGAHFDPAQIREHPVQVPTPATRVEHEIEIRLANAGASEQDLSAWLVDLIDLPGALSGNPTQGQTWYWKNAERDEYDLTESKTPSEITLLLGFDEMI